MNKTIKRMCKEAILLALLIIGAQIVVPLEFTKFTLQLLVVFLIAFIGDYIDILVVIGTYVLIGVLGVPVFAGFTGGFGCLSSSTFGFVIGFLPSALVIKLFDDLFFKLWKNEYASGVVAGIIGVIVLYIFGWIWGFIYMNYILESSSFKSFWACFAIFVAPYIWIDAIKMVIVLLARKPLKKIYQK